MLGKPVSSPGSVLALGWEVQLSPSSRSPSLTYWNSLLSLVMVMFELDPVMVTAVFMTVSLIPTMCQSWALCRHYLTELSRQSWIREMREQSLRQVKSPGQGHTTAKLRSQGLYSGLFPPELGLLVPEKTKGEWQYLSHSFILSFSFGVDFAQQLVFPSFK